MSRPAMSICASHVLNFRGFASLICSVLLLSTLSFAQYRASLQGTVTDAQGGVVPGATVTLTSRETNFVKTATTSQSGVYSISGLAPGSYSLSVEAQGFAKKDQDI